MTEIPATLPIQELLDVLEEIRSAAPTTVPQVRAARIAGVRRVAERRRVRPEAVRDRCWWRLRLPTIGVFDALIHGWLNGGEDTLMQRMLTHAIPPPAASERHAIRALFGRGREGMEPA